MSEKDVFIKQALVGTGNPIPWEAPSPIKEMIEQLQPANKEQEFLLTAGVLSVYNRAGRKYSSVQSKLSIANKETLPTCSPSITRILARMFAGEQHEDLLPEVLDKMAKCKLRLPHTLLPAALETKSDEVQKRLLPVLGERGLWLSKTHTKWKWARVQKIPGEEISEESKDLWEFGNLQERRSILFQTRESDPKMAREWLENSWPQEKLEHRLKFLDILEVGLSNDDEAFLKKLLKDRSTKVIEKAVGLLVRLQGEYVQKMISHASGIVKYDATGKKPLTISLPKKWKDEWKKDGLINKTIEGYGQRSSWCVQILQYVPPEYWLETFGLTIQELIVEVEKNKDWRSAFMDGITRAALLFDQKAVFSELWNWWLKNKPKGNYYLQEAQRKLVLELFEKMPAKDLDDAVKNMIGQTKWLGWETVLQHIPAPWSEALAEKYITELHNYMRKLKKTKHRYNDPWLETLPLAAKSMPTASFKYALENIQIPDADGWYYQQWHEKYDFFHNIIRIRKSIHEEIR